MDNSTPATLRRSEDIALDLLKFVAAHSNLKTGSNATPGFAAPSTAKSDDQVTQLLELYARCRQAVESPVSAAKK